MSTRKRLSFSTCRRYKLTDLLLAEGLITMRPCSACTSRGVLCVVSPRDERCEQCYRSRRQCDLASPWAEDGRLKKQEEELREQALAAQAEALTTEAKVARLRKQARLVEKRRQALWEREKQNIDELEVDEAVAEALEPSAEEQPQTALSPTGLF
jgi:hypothetical protein